MSGLNGPHNPRFIDGEWIVCDSHASALVVQRPGEAPRRVALGGFTRGFDWDERFFYVGESANRKAPIPADYSSIAPGRSSGRPWKSSGASRIPVPGNLRSAENFAGIHRGTSPPGVRRSSRSTSRRDALRRARKPGRARLARDRRTQAAHRRRARLRTTPRARHQPQAPARRMKTALITGVAGFLGRYAAREFLRDGWRVVVGLDDVPPENAPSGVEFHLHAFAGPGVRRVARESRPGSLHSCCWAGLGGVFPERTGDGFPRGRGAHLRPARRAPPPRTPRCRFILLSSAAVYGNPASLPVAETFIPCSRSPTPYGWHKRQKANSPWSRSLPASMGNPRSPCGFFPPMAPACGGRWCGDICERTLTTRPTHHLHGTGDESRDFIHATDIALCASCVARDPRFCHRRGRDLTISPPVARRRSAELATTLLTHLGSASRPQFDGQSTPGDPRNWRADIARLAALGFAPETTLEEGLRGVAAWCRAEMAAS